MKKILLLLLFIPLIVLAQDQSADIHHALDKNVGLVEQFAQLAPMGINPYLTVFLTSLCSKLGIHNDFVATSPFFNSWVVLIIFGILFLFTALVGTVFKTNKATATIGLADSYLSNNAALIVNGIIMLLPAFLDNSPQGQEVILEAGFLSVTFKTVLILAVSMYFLVVVMTVRFFIDILIFLSPVPLIDSILEIAKIAIAVIFIMISIYSPLTSVIIAGVMFLFSLLLYKRAVKLVNKTKYLVVYPVLNLLRSKEKVLTNGSEVSILTLVNEKFGSIKKGTIARLEKQDGQLTLIKKRFLLPDTKEPISLEQCQMEVKAFQTQIKHPAQNIHLTLNRSYRSYSAEVRELLGISIHQLPETTEQNEKGFLKNVKSMFSSTDFNKLKTSEA